MLTVKCLEIAGDDPAAKPILDQAQADIKAIERAQSEILGALDQERGYYEELMTRANANFSKYMVVRTIVGAAATRSFYSQRRPSDGSGKIIFATRTTRGKRPNTRDLFMAFRLLAKKLIAALMITGMTTACIPNSAGQKAFMWEPETQAEKELRQKAEALQSTVGEGATAGFVLGALIGGLTGGMQGAFQGARLGRFVGAASGAYVRWLAV